MSQQTFRCQDTVYFLCQISIILLFTIGFLGCEKVPNVSGNGASGNSASGSGTKAQRDPEQSDGQDLAFKPKVVIPRAFPAIVKPKSSTVEEGRAKLRPDELVLGVEVNGVARAYPINMLTGPQREIVNDELGGQPIAATW